MKYRTSSEIIPEILEACRYGRRITAICFAVHLGHTRLRPYVDELLRTGLLGLDSDESTMFTTTPTGLDYLAKLKELQELCPRNRD